MTATRKIEIEVSEEVARYLDGQVATGRFADAHEVIRHALEQARDAERAMENHLREAAAEWRAAPDDVAPLDVAFDGLLERYLARRGQAA